MCVCAESKHALSAMWSEGTTPRRALSAAGRPPPPPRRPTVSSRTLCQRQAAPPLADSTISFAQQSALSSHPHASTRCCRDLFLHVTHTLGPPPPPSKRRKVNRIRPPPTLRQCSFPVRFPKKPPRHIFCNIHESTRGRHEDFDVKCLFFFLH